MPDGQREPATGAPSTNQITVEDHQDEVALDPVRWQAFTETVIDALGVRAMAVSVTFVDATEIAALKAEHLDGDGGPTDVLAFPLDEPCFDAPDQPADEQDEPPLVLGDIVVCPSVAAAQAPRHAGTLDDELALLLVHAALHLVGHDHDRDDDRAVMQAEEQRLLAALHGPLAADPWTDLDPSIDHSTEHDRPTTPAEGTH